MLERILNRVFAFQRFSSNMRLRAIITEAERRYRVLDGEDLFLVAAAGDMYELNDFGEQRCEQK